uniref:Uncharacterized protein n=1 Tax=Monodelphis domestica TaxID=13616 RepID=A0A5F8H049_MONDO
MDCPLGGGRRGELGSLSAHLEVLGVNVQLLGVEVAQIVKDGLHIVQVLHSLSKRSQHLLAMRPDAGVPVNGNGAGQVPKVAEVPLGPGVDDQQPEGFVCPKQNRYKVCPSLAKRLPVTSSAGRESGLRGLLGVGLQSEIDFKGSCGR